MEDFAKKLDTYLAEYYEKFGNSGILRVTLKDVTLYERYMGYADRDARRPFTEKSMFNLYSISKPFLVLGLMKLKEKGLVDLDAHPGVYVPEAKGFDPRVTIRHMLHHVSGLPDFIQTADFPHKYPTGHPEQLREHLLELASYPQQFEPGTQTMYANINMNIGALIIENVTGLPYCIYMQQEVFDPLGVTTAMPDHAGLIVSDRVTGYMEADGKIQPIDRWLHWMHGAGDMIGTVDDVYCLNKAIKHKLLLRPETWEEILKPYPGRSFSMGCRVNDWHGKTRIVHNGGSPGFRTLHIQLPEDDLDIIYLSNAGWGDARTDLSEAVFSAFYGEKNSAEALQIDTGYI
jgi:CubicO group peptidase (beta-lactamase class C family)